MLPMGQFLVFLFSGFVAVQAFAALFLLVDLSYARLRYWRRIAAPVTGWWLLWLVCYAVTPSACENAYLYGAGTVPVVQVVNFYLMRWLLSLPFRVR